MKKAKEAFIEYTTLVVLGLIACMWIIGMPDYYKTKRDTYMEKHGKWTYQTRMVAVLESPFWPLIYVENYLKSGKADEFMDTPANW